MVSDLQPRLDRHGAGRRAGAKADHHHVLLVRRQQRREVAEHPLQPHVLRLARRLHLAGVVIVQHAVRQPRHRDRRHHPFALVDDLVGLAHARRRVAAVGNQQARHFVHAADQQRADADHHGDQHHAGNLRPEAFVLRRRLSATDRLEHQQPGHHADDDEHLLRVLAADPRHEQQAGAQRADDGADGVGRIDAADQTRGILSARRDRRQRQREARAPQDRGGQHGPQAAHQIELQREPRIARNRRIDRPVRQRLRQHVGAPGNRRAERAADTTRRRRGAAPGSAPATTRWCCRCPRPTRNAARISENVYVVAPKSSDRIRVQMTSAASAVIPDSAIAT